MAKKVKEKVSSTKSGITKPITGKFTQIGEILGLKKTKREEVADEKKLVNEIIEQNNRLREKLKALSFRTKKISEEQMAKDQRNVALLILKLSDYDISTMPDTREIDKALYDLCDELQEAYRKGDSLTAHYIIETLTYGIANGHRPLTANERKREDEIMQKREQKVQTYLKITQATQNVYTCGVSIQKNTEKVQDDKSKMQAKMKEIEDFKKDKKHPENAKAVEIIKNAGGRMNKLTGPALELATMMQAVVRIYKEAELLTKQVSLTKTDMNDYQTLVSQMEITLNEPNEHAKHELMEYAKDLGDQLLEKVNEQVSDILEKKAIINDYFNSMDSVFQQPALEEYVLGTLNEYEKMQRKFEEDKAAFGRMLANEGINEKDLEDSLDNEM